MTKRDELIALADGLSFAAQNTEGCLYSQRKMLNDASAALRLSALEAPAAGDGEPVAWQWRYRTQTGRFGTWEDGRARDWVKASRGFVYEERPLYTAPPADAGMREALQKLVDAWDALPPGRYPDATIAKWMNDTVWPAIEVGMKALTAPGATTKSDGGDCFWPQCSDRKRCTEYGSCVALAQRKAIAAGDLPSRPSDPSSTRSEVTVEELAKLACVATLKEQANRELFVSPPFWVYDAIARALLDQFEIRRKK